MKNKITDERFNDCTGSTDKRQIFNYWWNWLITLPNPEVQPLHQTLVKTWNHVNQSWAAALLIGSLITEAPVAGLLVSSWGPVVLCPLSGLQLNEQTEQAHWEEGGLVGNHQSLRLSPTPDDTFVSVEIRAEFNCQDQPAVIISLSLSFMSGLTSYENHPTESRGADVLPS